MHILWDAHHAADHPGDAGDSLQENNAREPLLLGHVGPVAGDQVKGLAHYGHRPQTCPVRKLQASRQRVHFMTASDEEEVDQAHQHLMMIWRTDTGGKTAATLWPSKEQI